MKLVGLPPGVEPWESYADGLSVTAVSADEVWVAGVESVYRYRDGEWQDAEAGSGCLTRATDGALWTTAFDGSVEYPGGGRLFRSTVDGSRPVTDRPALCGYGAPPSPARRALCG